MHRKRKRTYTLEGMIDYYEESEPILSKHLKELHTMVGMQELKQAVVAQIQFIKCNNGTDSHFLNTVLQGPPGCGKTSVAKILYNIWISLNIFHADTEFHIVHRSDLIGSFMGQTAQKTMKLLRKLSGGVIFIDEAYSLMNGEKDEYGKECLDTINSFLSEEKGKTIMILAGYAKDLKERVFSVNSGLERRFSWMFTIQKYTYQELYSIFVRQLKQHKWSCHHTCISLFKEHYQKFTYAGGDTENIAFKAKLEYSKDNWYKKKHGRRLSKVHVEKAILKIFDRHKEDVYKYMYI